MNEQYELIQYPIFSGMNIFINDITYRQPHRHDEYEICLVLEGRCRWSILGIDKFHLGEGDIIVVNPHDVHEISSLESQARFILVQFTDEFFLNMFPNDYGLYFKEQVVVSTAKFSVLLKSLLVLLSYQYFKIENKSYFQLLSIFYCMFNHLYNNLSTELRDPKAQTADSKKVERLSRLMDFSEKYYKTNISLSKFADEENLSLSYLSRFVKKNLNMSFQEYIQTLRFNEAKRLLLSTDSSVTQVSYDSGFSDPRYLNKLFDEKLNTTPANFRKNNKHTIIPNMNSLNADVENYLSKEESLKILEYLMPDARKTIQREVNNL